MWSSHRLMLMLVALVAIATQGVVSGSTTGPDTTVTTEMVTGEPGVETSDTATDPSEEYSKWVNFLCPSNLYNVARLVLCLPSHREVGTCCFTFACSLRPLSLCLCVPSYRAGRQTRDVDPMLHGIMLAHRLRRWPSIKPALVQRFVFAGTQSVSLCWGESVSIHFSPALSMVQAVKHEMLTRCWSNVGPPSTTLDQH